MFFKIDWLMLLFFFLSSKLLGDLSNMLTLELGAVEFDFRGHARTVGVRNGGSAVVRATVDSVDTALLAPAGRKTDDGHAVMEEDGVEVEDGGFLTAVLGGRRGHDGADLADEFASEPEAASSVEEGLHLSGHHSETSGSAEDDAVIFGEFVGVSDGNVLEGFLSLLGAHLFENFDGESFLDTLEGDFGTFDLLGTFDGGFSHGDTVTISGVDDNEDLDHCLIFCFVFVSFRFGRDFWLEKHFGALEFKMLNVC